MFDANEEEDFRRMAKFNQSIADAAALLGQSITDFVEAGATEQAQQISSQQTLHLTNEERNKFFAAIDSPAEPTPAMRLGAERAMRMVREGMPVYSIYQHDTLIGYSDFEDADPTMFNQTGIFYPSDGYQLFADFFQEFSLLAFDSSRAPTQAERDRMEARMEEIRSQYRELAFYVKNTEGETLESGQIEITDFGTLLDEKPEIILRFFDGDIYRRYFNHAG